MSSKRQMEVCASIGKGFSSSLNEKIIG